MKLFFDKLVKCIFLLNPRLRIPDLRSSLNLGTPYEANTEIELKQ
jgi:hypothetical protein